MSRTASAERVAGRYRVAMIKVPRDRGALKALLKDFWQYGTDSGSYAELKDVLESAMTRGVLRDDPLRHDDLVDAVSALEGVAQLEEDAYDEGWKWMKRHIKPLMDAL